MRQKRQQMKYRYRKFLLLAGVLVTVVIIGIILYRIGADSGGAGQTAQEQTQVKPKTEFTEEEKARVEAQTGVSINDEGIMEIDVGAILSEEASVKIKREEAENLVLERLGEGAQIETAGLREYEGVRYWVVRAGKGGEVRQVWLNADDGEEFINQKE